MDDCLTESNCVAFCVAFVVQDSIVAQGCWLPVMHIVCRFRIELKKTYSRFKSPEGKTK